VLDSHEHCKSGSLTLSDATHIELTPEEKKSIDEPYLPRPIIGHS
jgi:hypothetical protein